MKELHFIKKTVLICFFLSLAIHGFTQINYSQKQRLNDDWLFLKEDLGSIWEAVRPAAKGSSEEVPIWTSVTLPHCFNAEDAVDPDINYYQGPGWYKKMLEINNPYTDGRTILHFEGAGQKTEVYIYTQKVGSHVGGYDEWTVDITDAINTFLKSEDAKRFNGKIPLSIRCDNTRDTEMIPSDLSDFNLYGGIYRYLNLVYTPAIFFSGIQADASVDEKGKEGNLAIRASFLDYSEGSAASLNIKIFDPAGKLIKEENQQLNDFGNKDLLSLKVSKPLLWSQETPNLYSCELTLTSSKGSMACKEVFGFRHFEFKEKGPFFLNGKRLLLRGTHRHEDHAGVAAAMTEEQIVQEMEMMKSMGVNFIRLGHYQQSRIVLEACDRLGILVWEEIPWCRGGLGGDVYKDQARRMLTNMITQHRNHPSVILWGLGNENDWPNDFPEFDKEKIRTFMKELHNLSHKLDDSRLTCIRRCAFCSDIVDVYSPSIWAGWYRGIYTDYKKVSYEEMQKVKHFLHVEWGGDSHARRHGEDPYVGLDKIQTGKGADERAGDASLFGGMARASKDGSWSESYIVDLIDWHLKEQETMDWLTGAAYWPFKDFSTPVRPDNPVPYMNQKGVVERDLTPKEAFYVFQSYWTNEPMVHIYAHSWPIRWGKTDEPKTIKVYSNCEEVELFLNGKSLGVKKRNSQDFPAAGLRWETTLLQGKNTVKAIGIKKDKKNKVEVVDEISFEYETRPFGKEAEIVTRILSEDANSIWIEAELRDNNGVICLDSRKYVRFESVGDGQLIKNQGTSSGSSKVQAYNGRARIQLKKNSGQSVIAVKSEGLKTVFVSIK
ncbi:MAG: glycoside hydrolase family 2 TIM barrel-domain containing protein [Dysgonomonas sp.]|nr:glycoside hydrolase family 2 TIM barrel-domain containing protein [Dysgonomonas sp.]